MQQQDVLLADHAEQVLGLLQQLGDQRGEGRVLQLRVAVQPRDAEQAGQVHRAIDLVQLAFGQAELLEQVVREVLRAGVGHFQAHRVAVTAREQLATQGTRQVVDVLGVHRQVGVTGQAELVAAFHLHAGEQVVGMGVDHRGEEDEVVPRATDVLGHADHPRQQARRRNDRQAGIAAEGIDAFQLDDEVEALVHQQREGVRRVQADGGDDRRDLVAEVAAHPALELGGPVAAADEVDLVLGQLRQQDVVEDAVLAGHLLVHQLADPRQRLVRQQAVGAGLFAGEGDLLLQAGDADLEELVEVAGEDQQELQALEQRGGLVERLLQDADIELQLRQLAVDVQAAVVQPRYRGRRLDDVLHGLDLRLGHGRQRGRFRFG
ncbi:hypothetical protein D3C78_275260 [compost metagenome]